jgi:hypothetical protein
MIQRMCSKKLEVGDASAIKGASSILESCGINAAEARKIIEELNSLVAEDGDQFFDPYAPSVPEPAKQSKSRRRGKGKQKSKRQQNLEEEEHHTGGTSHAVCQHCGGEDAAVACMSCGPSGSNSSKAKDAADALARGYLLCGRCDREEHADHKGHIRVRLETADGEDVDASGAAAASGNSHPKVTIGLIGHPNVGKSSVLNALAGKKIVSVSHTPGHTKRLQTILITSDICICDCPGLVFPFAGVPKYLQELCGLYPYSQVRGVLTRQLSPSTSTNKVVRVWSRSASHTRPFASLPNTWSSRRSWTSSRARSTSMASRRSW